MLITKQSMEWMFKSMQVCSSFKLFYVMYTVAYNQNQTRFTEVALLHLSSCAYVEF
jgi:hypothetical protein